MAFGTTVETAMPPPLTFVRAAETWVPSADGSELVAAPNSFGTVKRLEALGRAQGFKRGEGLPGRAWAEGRPILMRELDAAYFQRAAAAQEALVTCAIAVPVFLGGSLKAVLVLFCGHVAGRPGALELWHADPKAGTGMTLVDGAYGESSQAFEAASRTAVLPRGDGLPGMAWQRGEIQFVEDLAAASPRQFARAEQAQDIGMQRGLAIPFGSLGEGGYVAAFLASVELPLALAVERWEPDAGKQTLLRTYAFTERRGGRSKVPAELPLAGSGLAQGAVGAAFATGVPTVSDAPAHEPGPNAGMASDVGASALVAIPVVWGGSLIRGVVTLYL
jgi:hypothetical protein